ncbi:hypothetical protein [Trinickia fusca]|uniref:Uncharacterized protein n=1 Tax=Trinickia fusca TaxID=2419777 RepID=A0A494XP36_9BURK|nr:hypothetical protein [Trinickia fusca]RKP50516.1 hypothetical protein D7S89_05265 [Trinickia fusca]
MTREQSEQIEALLSMWYRWQIRQSQAEILAHYYHTEDGSCRGYETPYGEDDEEDAYATLDDRQSEQVQMCVDALPIEARAAISVSMRNKECGSSVWRSARAGEQHAVYQAAKARLLPMFAARGLLRLQEQVCAA